MRPTMSTAGAGVESAGRPHLRERAAPDLDRATSAGGQESKVLDCASPWSAGALLVPAMCFLCRQRIESSRREEPANQEARPGSREQTFVSILQPSPILVQAVIASACAFA